MFLRWKRKMVTRVAAYFQGCQHGTSTERVTPQILESYRDKDGKPKHRVVWTGPSFRMCCVELHTERALWWRNAELGLGAVPEDQRTRFKAQMAEIIPGLSREEWTIYHQHYLNNPFEPRPYESWDEMNRRYWVEACRRYHASKAREQARREQAWESSWGPSECMRVFGLNPGFTQAELKKAWRAAALKHHPDQGGSHEAFIRMKQAYEFLVVTTV